MRCVKLKYSKVILDSIDKERAGVDYSCSDADLLILRDLFSEINQKTGNSIKYLAEITLSRVVGSGDIIAQYILHFSSETVRAYLIHQLVSDKTKDCDQLLLQLYQHFKTSDEYISKAGKPSPAHIYTRYDSAFKTLKSKRIKEELVKLVHNPRDAFYLPFTTKMLASWKIPELEELLISYTSGISISAQDVGIECIDDTYLPPLDYIKRELRLTALAGLKNYPSNDTLEIVMHYTEDANPDVREAAKKTLKSLLKAFQ